MFGCSPQIATALALPATYATAFGFMFCYGRQLNAMSESGLVSPFLGVLTPNRGTPMGALLYGAIIGYMECLVIYLVPFVGTQLFNVCIIGAFGAYGALCLSFLECRNLFPHMQRPFTSPFGVFGAYYALSVFSLAAVGVIAYQEDYTAIIVFSMYLASVTIYYMLVVNKRQFFSGEEKQVLFKVHVIKSKLCVIIMYMSE
jgi:amino acid permease